MDRPRCLVAIVLICLLSICHARGNRFVLTYFAMRAPPAMVVYMSDLTALFTWTCSRCTDLTEVWVHNVGIGSLVYMIEKVCDSSGEDPSCSRYMLGSVGIPISIRCMMFIMLITFSCAVERSVSGNSISDHLAYFGIEMQADTWGTCRIVFHGNVVQSQVDIAGNTVLSKRPGVSSALQQNVEADKSRNAI
ncbi:hypothetical protein B296_00031048 [Ensete ventricosum]|uniref:Uncharacterized protein n=1 Tax=Ensete ventricosum TaxID=4639 RepID=A0A427AF84_ENSVE|nr:hypothetical protein B296_00031048 [Ensete ventricosum]